MISYGRDELDALVHSISKHWGGQARDWRLVVETVHHGDSPSVALHVEIALGSFTRITTIPLSRPLATRSRHGTALAVAPQDAPCKDGSAALAAVRRASLLSLLAQTGADDIEPLLGYLRCCGILVMD